MDEVKEPIYFTVTSFRGLPDISFIKEDTKLFLEKEPDNKYDREAIAVSLPGLGKFGYVANSVRTVLGESYSAGRLYDKIGDTAKGKILYDMDNAWICELI